MLREYHCTSKFYHQKLVYIFLGIEEAEEVLVQVQMHQIRLFVDQIRLFVHTRVVVVQHHTVLAVAIDHIDFEKKP